MLAYLPIDIDARIPDEKKLLEFCDQFHVPHSPTAWHQETPVIFRGPHEDLYSTLPNTGMRGPLMEARYFSAGYAPATYVNDIDKVFPEIPYMLNQLPFKEITIAMLARQLKYIQYHNDDYSVRKNGVKCSNLVEDQNQMLDIYEPRRYNILLTKHHYKDCFFVSTEIEGEKIYPAQSPSAPCHAINLKHYYHGADFRGPDKVVLLIDGILDLEKHKKMIDSNMAKYQHSGAIIF